MPPARRHRDPVVRRPVGEVTAKPLFKEVAQHRSQLYWLLSSLYLRTPNAAFLQDLTGWLAASSSTDPEDNVACGLAMVQQAAAECNVERLTVEYTRLFGGIKEGYGPPPPYESMYRESCLMGATTEAVTRTYAEAGFGTIHAAAGPQDHIGAELKFMSLVCCEEISVWEREEPDAAVSSWKLQRGFLDEHLLRWVPAYCRRLQQETSERFYAGAAALTEHAVAADREIVGHLLNEFAIA